MARFARVVAVDAAHHVTQRGDARQFLLATDAERRVYRDLLRQAVRVHALSVIGYSLMSNHVHVVAIPRQAEDLAETLQRVHGRYASSWNAAHASSGHAWQGRFYSCPMDEGHLWSALRYTERNPVRAGLVKEAAQWSWSSAAAHCGSASPDAILEMERWQRRWTPEEWVEFLAVAESHSDLTALRQCTHTGRPLGTPDFVVALEKSTSRPLAPRRAGRHRKSPADSPPPLGFAA